MNIEKNPALVRLVLTFALVSAQLLGGQARSQAADRTYRISGRVRGCPGAISSQRCRRRSFAAEHPVLRDFDALSQGAVAVELKSRERKMIALGIRETKDVEPTGDAGKVWLRPNRELRIP